MSGNGMQTFSMHSLDTDAQATISTLQNEVQGATLHAFAGAPAINAIDPETAARRYLARALASTAVPSFTAPVANQTTSEFKSIGAETLPLTGTTTVKFRQNFSKVPVYGSLVTVELDDANNLIGIDSALGTPQGVAPVASLSAADAAAAVARHPGFRKELAGITPRLNYYFDPAAAKWRLVFILEDVPVVPDVPSKERAPVLMDYFVDAHSGDVLAEYPRTPTVAMEAVGTDGFGKQRSFKVTADGEIRELLDSALMVHTFDFGFADPVTRASSLPGTPVRNPPVFSPSAVSAHANACEVSKFMREVLKRENIDNRGGLMVSSINCVDMSDSPDNQQWLNAFWNGRQMVYGQRRKGDGSMLSMSAALDVVAHEMFHGVTDKTSRLVYALQPGALNESYSDIFGILVANQGNPDPGNWNWKLGLHLVDEGEAFRDLSNPPLHDQPDHMSNFRVLPNTRFGDQGGVHINSGIPNKAAYLILTAKRNGTLVLQPREVAAIFYLALTQRLTPTSQFSDSRTAILNSARTLLRHDAPDVLAAKIQSVEEAFDAVGIA